jgi:photosystem II stability/assembly factor-like uncharacterized protein
MQRTFTFVMLLFGMLTPLFAQNDLAAELFQKLQYRNIGPFRPGCWVVDIAVPEQPQSEHLYTIYLATRNAGLYKSTNNGTTWTSVFNSPEVHALGAVAVAPSNANVIYVGTGDSYYARSSYSGNGVHKSTDGGKNWTHCGLPESQHIGKILVHPKDPNTVYVAAMGHLFGPNPERGVFKSNDGGKTWQKALFISDNTGIVDLAMDVTNPNVIYAAAYEKYRYPWTLLTGGKESGIYKSVDAGKSWKKLSQGLPTGDLGRIGLDVCRSKPNVVYAVIENVNLRDPFPAESKADTDAGREPQKREIGGEVYRSDDAGATWRKTNRAEDNVGGKAAYSFNTLRVDPQDPQKVYVTGLNLQHSYDGGKTWKGIEWTDTTKIFREAFGDVRTLYIDPFNSQRMLLGSDGGLHLSYDGGTTCDYYDNIPGGEIYAIGVDMEEPYNIYAGLQDHDSWKGPSNAWSGEITLENWVPVGGGDGMYNQIDPSNNRWVYNEEQFGNHIRVDQWTGERKDIAPRRPASQKPYRWNWSPPIRLSPHNPSIIYTGAEVLLRSLDRGDHWQEISPDLTTNHPHRINGKGNIQFCTITTIAESPLQAGVIWVGTDDGRVWVSKNHGSTWTESTAALIDVGGPKELWVSRVFASAHRLGTAYVTKTGFRVDDFKPYVFKTNDFGMTWTRITTGLPDKPVNVIYEDPKNPELLYLGNDKGVYITLNGGENWQHFQSNMPPSVPVHDLLIHPRENDLVVGTYGRGIFVADISPLQEWKPELAKTNFHLLDIEPKALRLEGTQFANYHLYGNRHIRTPNEPNGLCIRYFTRNATDSTQVSIKDINGKVLRTWKILPKAGLNELIWNFRAAATGGRRRNAENPVAPGDYVITLEQAGQKQQKIAKFTKILGWKIGAVGVEKVGDSGQK